MRVLSSLAAISGLASAPLVSAKGPLPHPREGTACDDLESGFCHAPSNDDKEFINEWNEIKGQGNNSLSAPSIVQEPPSYDPFAPGEYEKVDGILLAWDNYDLDVVANIAAGVTHPKQSIETRVYMVVSGPGEQENATAYFNAAGVNMDWVIWIEEQIDSTWIRDYGPRFICNPATGDRDGIDTKYYSHRPMDNSIPSKLAEGTEIGPHVNFDLNDVVMHSGGNGHYFSTGKAFSTKILLEDNNCTEGDPCEQQLKDYWMDFKGAELHLLDGLNSTVDRTGHVDMFMLPVDNNTVIVGEWAEEDVWGSKAITDGVAAYMVSEGYTVLRTPNWSTCCSPYGPRRIHYTYTNAVIVNDVVVMSSFGVPQDDVARQVFEVAFPGRTIVQVDSSMIIERSGALHCMSQHVYDCGGSRDRSGHTIASSLKSGKLGKKLIRSRVMTQ